MSISRNLHKDSAEIIRAVLEVSEQKNNAVILIDGRAGSGKSTFANQLENEIFKALEVKPRVVHMDDLYPGWEGLASGSSYLNQVILSPLSKGLTAKWQIWDWSVGQRGSATEPGNGWREFSGSIPLIVEGCGSISKQTALHADLRIWLECEAAVRRERWSIRDGSRFDEYWGIWAFQEDDFYRTEQSQDLADFFIES